MMEHPWRRVLQEQRLHGEAAGNETGLSAEALPCRQLLVGGLEVFPRVGSRKRLVDDDAPAEAAPVLTLQTELLDAALVGHEPHTQARNAFARANSFPDSEDGAGDRPRIHAKRSTKRDTVLGDRSAPANPHEDAEPAVSYEKVLEYGGQTVLLTERPAELDGEIAYFDPWTGADAPDHHSGSGNAVDEEPSCTGTVPIMDAAATAASVAHPHYSEILSGPGFSYGADDGGVFETADAITFGTVSGGAVFQLDEPEEEAEGGVEDSAAYDSTFSFSFGSEDMESVAEATLRAGFITSSGSTDPSALGSHDASHASLVRGLRQEVASVAQAAAPTINDGEELGLLPPRLESSPSVIGPAVPDAGAADEAAADIHGNSIAWAAPIGGQAAGTMQEAGAGPPAAAVETAGVLPVMELQAVGGFAFGPRWPLSPPPPPPPLPLPALLPPEVYLGFISTIVESVRTAAAGGAGPRGGSGKGVSMSDGSHRQGQSRAGFLPN